LIEPGDSKSFETLGETLKGLGSAFGFGKKPKTKGFESALNDKKYLSDFLNYREFKEDLNIFDNKSTYGFVLKLSPFCGIGLDEINALKKIVSYEIPSDAVVQVINYASPNITLLVDKWCNVIESKSGSNIYRGLSDKRRKFVLDGRNTDLWSKGSGVVLRNFEVYFCVSFEKDASVRSNSILLDRIVGVRSKISRAFSNIGCYVEHLTKTSLNEYLGEILFLEEEALLQRSGFQGTELIDFPSNPEYIMHEDFAEVRGKNRSKKFVLFEVDEWPIDWDMSNGIDYVGNFGTGRGIPFPFFISFGFKAEDPRESNRRATKMRVIRTNQTTSKLVNFVPAMREELEDWHYITDEIDKGARLAKSCMYVVALIDESVDEGNAAQDIVDHFYQLGFKLDQIKYDCLNSLIHTLPMEQAENWGTIKKNRGLTTMATSNCMNLLPIFADAQSSNNPLMMFVGRRGQVFFFDNYVAADDGNYNMVVVGKSGSGKSVFIQEYTTSILRQGGQVVVLDDGRSFQNSATILGGDFIDFKGKVYCINPFSLFIDAAAHTIKDYKADFEEPLIDLIVSILCVITNIDKNNIKDFEVGFYRTVLKDAVQVVLEKKGNKGGFRDVYLALKSDLNIRTAQAKDIADKLAHVVRPYAEGRYTHHFNGKAMLSVDNIFTVFELSSLQSDEVLQTSVLMMVVFLVYTKMQSRERRTALIIDEAWRLLRHDAIKEFIEGIARRARKYNGSLVVATQNISDFEKEKSEAAAAVLSQSDWRIILKAEGKDEKTLKEQLGMEREEVDIARGLKGEKGRYSEFMIRHSSDSWSIGRLMLDAFSVKLYSSKPKDVVRIQELKEQGHSLEVAIEQLITEEKNGR